MAGNDAFVTPGGGFQYLQSPGDPGAGNELLYMIANSPPARVLLMSLCFTFTTSAVVADRLVAFTVEDSGNVYARPVAPVVQTASLTWGYCFALGLAPVQVGLLCNAPWPQVTMEQEHLIQSVTENLDAGDSYQDAIIMFRRWRS